VAKPAIRVDGKDSDSKSQSRKHELSELKLPLPFFITELPPLPEEFMAFPGPIRLQSHKEGAKLPEVPMVN